MSSGDPVQCPKCKQQTAYKQQGALYFSFALLQLRTKADAHHDPEVRQVPPVRR